MNDNSIDKARELIFIILRYILEGRYVDAST